MNDDVRRRCDAVRAEIEPLLNRLADGLADDDDHDRLLELLDARPEVRQVAREYAGLHTLLHWDYAGVTRPEVPPDDRQEPPRGPWLRGRRIAALLAGIVLSGAAAALVVAVGLPRFSGLPRDESALRTVAAAQPLATVITSRHLTSALDGQSLNPGRQVEAGRLRIGGGAVEIHLRNGVALVLDGPCDLELLNDMEAFLHSGSVVVRMPQGMRGFRLGTATTDVLDLGTEFAVKAGERFVTDVQVYDGAVIATSRAAGAHQRFPTRLEAGESVRFSPHAPSGPLVLPYDEGRFVRRVPHDPAIELALPGPAHDASVGSEADRLYGTPRTASIAVTRPREAVVIDGRLGEWAESPGFQARLGGESASREWIDGRLMYDDANLYVAALVGDPYPLANSIDPTVDAIDVWKGGAVHLRLSTDRDLGWPVHANGPAYFANRKIEATADQKAAAENPRLVHLTMWLHAPTRTPCLSIASGMFIEDVVVQRDGFAGAFAKGEDGGGYTMEYRIPWELLHCAGDSPQPGDVLAANWQVMFSDETGRLWRTQIIDVRNPAEPPRIYTWERAATWGRAEYR